MNNPFEDKRYLFNLERNNILKNIAWISVLLISDFVFFMILIFKASFLMSLPFLIYASFVFLFLCKNLINLWMLNFANNQLDHHDLNINIYFKWIRKQIGLKILTIFFIGTWIIFFALYQTLFSLEIIKIETFNSYMIFAFGSLLIFLLQLFINWTSFNQFIKLFAKTQSQMPWSKSFDLEITMTQRQAVKDYNQLILIILAVITVLPAIAYLIYKYTQNKIIKNP